MQFELTDEIRNLIVFAMEDQGNSYLFDSVDQKTVIESTIDFVDEDRYYKIPTWDSMKGFKLMERFISILRNPLAREELRGVLLSGKGVFRNFKNVLHQYPEVEKLWFSFKEKEMRLIVSNWYDTFLDSWGLEKLGFEPEENSDVVYDDFVFRVAYENHDNCQNDSELLFSASEMFCQEFEKQHQSEIGFTLSELWKSQLNSFNPESEFSVIAETVEGDFAGACITFGYEEGAFHTAVISALYVEPCFRGLGIGKELINQSITELKNRGKRWILVPSVLISSFVAEMLLSCGFTQLGTGFVLSL